MTGQPSSAARLSALPLVLALFGHVRPTSLGALAWAWWLPSALEAASLDDPAHARAAGRLLSVLVNKAPAREPALAALVDRATAEFASGHLPPLVAVFVRGRCVVKPFF